MLPIKGFTHISIVKMLIRKEKLGRKIMSHGSLKMSGLITVVDNTIYKIDSYLHFLYVSFSKSPDIKNGLRRIRVGKGGHWLVT